MTKIPDSALQFQHHDWTGIPTEQLPDGSLRQMIWGERLTVCRLRLPRRLVTTAHSHPHEQITIVERGPVLFTIGNTKRVVETGEVLHFPPNTWHGATMLDEDVILIDVFSPVREDFLSKDAVRNAPSSASPLDLFRLDQKIALVTGSSRGLGAGMALALAGAGADIALHGSSDPPSGSELTIASTTGRRTELLTGDLSQESTAERLIAETIERFGRIDILVNNAGIIRRQPAADHSDENWDAVLEVSLSSVFRLCRAAGRHMLERGSGKIINIASMLSFQGGINVVSYAAAKGGIAQLTKALANEWAPRGINVNAIAPGYMATENTTALRNDPVRSAQILDRIPAGRWGTPADLAGAVVFLASNASNYVHGHVLVVDGGWLSR